MAQTLTRRDFLKTSTTAAGVALALPAIVPPSVFGADAPSSRVTMGCIGTGGQGSSDMKGFKGQSGCQVVAVCDVDASHAEKAAQTAGLDAKACYKDFRDVLARGDIDTVLIATPDHWHVPVAIAAAEAGKDMYVEKPLGLTVAEDQMLRKVCQSNQRIFQFGTQQRSGRQFRQACELARNGRLGKLKQINVWAAASRPGGPNDPVAIPEDLNYDFWLGPAPQTPYTEGKAFDTAKSWKTWWYNYDYALGFIAGWGIHPLDIAVWGHPDMMKGPMEIEGKGIIPKEGACNTSVAWDVNFTFADGVKMQYRGTRNGAEASELNNLGPWEKKYGRAADHGTAFEGTDGWVLVDRGAIRTSPESLLEEKGDDYKVKLIRSSNHVRNLLDSIKSRKPAICPIEDSVQGDILCHLSDIVTRLNRKLKWDPVKEKFLDDKEANTRLALRKMRSPWGL